MIEIEATVISRGEKRLCNSSMENIMAVIGDDAAIEKPAAAPPVIIYRRQPLLFFEAKQLITPSPTAVPNCTQGPSVPNGRPQKNDINAEKGRIIMLDHHLKYSIP